jgi:hypothetical protein
MFKIFIITFLSFFIWNPLYLALYAQGNDKYFDLHQMHWARYRARAILDRNLVWCPVWNIGLVSDSMVQPRNLMRWPGSQGLEYLWEGVFFIGAKVTNMSAYEGKVVPETWDGRPISIISSAFRTDSYQKSSDGTHQHIWQPIPGFYNDGKYGFVWGINEDINNDGDLSSEEDINYNGILDLNLEPPESIINGLAISTDLRTWPQYWPGGSYIGDDRPYFGRPPRTTVAGERAGRWNGEYKAAPIADQETLYRMDDHENDYWNDHTAHRYWPMKNPDGTPDTTPWQDGGIAGAGIEVEARTYSWFHPLAEDLLVSVYRVRNYSDYVLNHVNTGMLCDVHIGGSALDGSYCKADYILAKSEGDRDEFDIIYQWLRSPGLLATNQTIGTFGFAFLETPGIDYNGLDDDADGLVDESMEDGIDNDEDWQPFSDIGLDNLSPTDEDYKGPDEDGTEGNGRWDTEDVNLNGVLDAGEDVNYNNNIDMEPVNDDRGTDGIGPDENGWPGPDKDGSECNGLINLGEPDFDLTDIDEADQAGLKHVLVQREAQELQRQDKFWDKFLEYETRNIDYDDDDFYFAFAARNVKLEKKWKRFTIALIMGENQDDAIRNKAIMQDIYDNNYRFLTPPLQPTLVANVSDRKVQLYWDSKAENSVDEFLGKDFNGYRIYKSTDPKFLDIKTISDAFGNVLLFKPLVIYDKDDGLRGAHPIPFPTTGGQYDMGKDSGLQHSYDDTEVHNGRTYFYAVTAIDAGNDWDFYERKLVTKKYNASVMPSESPFNITVNTLGEVVYRSRNTTVCVPSEPAAGFREPFVDTLNVDHVSGTARIEGNWSIQVFNKNSVNPGHKYEISFADDGWLDQQTLYYSGGRTSGITCRNFTTGDTLYHLRYLSAFDLMQSGYAELEKGVWEGLHFAFDWPLLSGEQDKGIRVIKTYEQDRETNQWKKWVTDSKTNLQVEKIKIEKSDNSVPLPLDVEIRVEDLIGIDTSITNHPLIKKYPLNFTTWDVTDPDYPKQLQVMVFYDKTPVVSPPEMYGQIWDSTRIVLTYFNKNAKQLASSWSINFFKNVDDTLNLVIPPSPGDVYRFRTWRNPTHLDTLRFSVEGGEWSQNIAAEKMRNIFVVPDPYVVGSSFEPIYELAGQNQRRIDFVNLPPKCTIRIFTASGKLVKTLEHAAPEDFGRHSWDLTSEDGPEIAFGMYFFVVEAKGVGIKRGKFAVIK